METEIMTVNEVAEYLRMNPMTIYKMAQQNKIPASKIMGSWRFRRQEIDNWLNSQTVQSSKILVIDDDPDIRTSIRDVMKNNHFVIVAENAQEALNILKDNQFNLIFLDLKLPDMDGLSLYKEIKEQASQIPVVVITGSTDMELLSKVVAEGAQFILNKPFTENEIRQMLNFIKV